MSFAQDGTSNVGRGFLSAAEKFDKERGPLDDTNAFFSCNGYGVRQIIFPCVYNLLNIVFSFRDGQGE